MEKNPVVKKTKQQQKNLRRFFQSLQKAMVGIILEVEMYFLRSFWILVQYFHIPSQQVLRLHAIIFVFAGNKFCIPAHYCRFLTLMDTLTEV